MEERKEHESIWSATTAKTNFPKLSGSTETEIVIVGGGLVGLSTAYLLAKEGRKVVVIEMNNIAGDVTAHTTAKITALQGLKYQQLLKNFNLDSARLYYESNTAGIEKFFDIVNEENILCNLERKDMIIFSEKEEKAGLIDREKEVLEKIGAEGLTSETHEFPDKINFLGLHNQAQFHPRKFLLGLAEKILSMGGIIYEHTVAHDIRGEKQPVVICDSGRIKAEEVVIATNFPFYDKSLFFTRLFPYRSYALALERSDKSGTDNMYYCIDDSEISLRDLALTTTGKALILGGGNHKAGQVSDTNKYYENLVTKAEQLFPGSKILNSWSTQDNTTPDGLPYVGKIPGSNNIYMATGFDGWGMANSMMSAMLITDQIVLGHSKWEDLYDPSRKTAIQSAVELIKENWNVAEKFIGDRRDIEESKLGGVTENAGKVIKIDGNPEAVYRENDEFTELNPKCTHLGCIVNFNSAEKTWDCPCHGSRFFHDGEVLHGPANKPLKKIEKL